MKIEFGSWFKKKEKGQEYLSELKRGEPYIREFLESWDDSCHVRTGAYLPYAIVAKDFLELKEGKKKVSEQIKKQLSNEVYSEHFEGYEDYFDEFVAASKKYGLNKQAVSGMESAVARAYINLALSHLDKNQSSSKKGEREAGNSGRPLSAVKTIPYFTKAIDPSLTKASEKLKEHKVKDFLRAYSDMTETLEFYDDEQEILDGEYEVTNFIKYEMPSAFEDGVEQLQGSESEFTPADYTIYYCLSDKIKKLVEPYPPWNEKPENANKPEIDKTLDKFREGCADIKKNRERKVLMDMLSGSLKGHSDAYYNAVGSIKNDRIKILLSGTKDYKVGDKVEGEVKGDAEKYVPYLLEALEKLREFEAKEFLKEYGNIAEIFRHYVDTRQISEDAVEDEILPAFNKGERKLHDASNNREFSGVDFTSYHYMNNRIQELADYAFDRYSIKEMEEKYGRSELDDLIDELGEVCKDIVKNRGC